MYLYSTHKQQRFEPGLVSIIVPCWNSSSFVSATLISINAQTYNNIETIVVDDGSIDCLDTVAVAKEHNSTVICKTSNRGAPSARNIGEAVSKGEYLLFCDSDVILYPSAVEDMVQALRTSYNASWVYCNYMLGDKFMKFWPFSVERFYLINCSSTMSMIKHEHFPGWDESIKRFQDWDLFLTMFENGHVPTYVDKILFTAIDRATGISRNSISEKEAMLALTQKHKSKKIKRLK